MNEASLRAPNSPHRHPPSSLRDPRFSYVQAKPHRPYTVRIWTCHSASASKQAGRQVGRQASPSCQPAGTRSRRSSGRGRSIHLPLHPSQHIPYASRPEGVRSSSTYVAAASRHPAGRSRVGPSTYTPAASPASFLPCLPCLPCVLPSIFGRRGRRSGTMKRSERVRLSQIRRLYR